MESCSCVRLRVNQRLSLFLSHLVTHCVCSCVCSSKVNFVPRLRFEILKLIIEFHRTYEKVNKSIDLSLGLCIPGLLLKYASQQRWDVGYGRKQ